jgi:CubicO group peptidase (beta-lactamase class C family)
MADLPSTLQTYIDHGVLPGAVALVTRAGRTEVTVVGSAAVGGAPMARDSIFRLASITKPITAAAGLLAVRGEHLTGRSLWLDTVI